MTEFLISLVNGFPKKHFFFNLNMKHDWLDNLKKSRFGWKSFILLFKPQTIERLIIQMENYFDEIDRCRVYQRVRHA